MNMAMLMRHTNEVEGTPVWWNQQEKKPTPNRKNRADPTLGCSWRRRRRSVSIVWSSGWG